MHQIQVHIHWVAGSNPARGYDIARSEVEILCRYSNRRVLGDIHVIQEVPTLPSMPILFDICLNAI